MKELALFTFVLCLVFTAKVFVVFLLGLFIDSDKFTPIILNKYEKTLLYFTISYILTYIIIN